MKTIAVTAVLLSLSVMTLSQAAFITSVISSLPEAEAVQVRTYTRESLYGYINGGAELYLEYGFDTLIVTEMTCDGRDIRAEIYRMKDEEAAFGIFSVSRYRCNGGPKMTEHLCRSAYQLQFCKGPYYVNIINDTGSEADQKTADKITSLFLERITGSSFVPARFFEELPDAETMKSAVLVRGQLGIYNGIPYLSETFGKMSGYTALIIKDGGKTKASVIFDDEKTPAAYNSLMKNKMPKGTAVMSGTSSVASLSPTHILITFE